MCSSWKINYTLDPEIAYIHPSAWIDQSARLAQLGFLLELLVLLEKMFNIDENVSVGTHCHVGDNCIIGSETAIYPGVKLLSRCEMGKNSNLNRGVVIGSEGYGFDQVNGAHHKIPHLGK